MDNQPNSYIPTPPQENNENTPVNTGAAPTGTTQGSSPTYTPHYNGQASPYGQAPSYTPGAPYYTPPAQPYNSGYTNQGGPSPSQIYYSRQNGAPQYHYGAPTPGIAFNNDYYTEQREAYNKKKNAERKIRGVGNIAGAAMIGCMIVALMFSVALVIPPLLDLYDSNFSAKSLINMFYTLVVVGGTMAVFGIFFKRHAQAQAKEYGGVNVYEFTTKFTAPKNKLQAVLLILISFGGCMLANYVSSILLTILESFGLYSTYNSIQDPKTISDLIVFFLSVAVMPALIEEFAVRGILLSHLRRYGNGFAIITSAIFFGVFHGDAAQIPFAFICGLFFAYTVIATDSLWPGIIIHAMNNSLSCISSVLMQVADEETANMFFYVVSIAGIVLGGACLLIYRNLFKDDGVLKFQGDAIELTLGQKVGKFLTSPLMIVALGLYFLQALLTLTTQQLS